ncbi:hypothetical protein DIU31_023980 [Mucilaginibacter rubeus]|uniref:Uncharacterized protein n=1 Tax=Mucilaginibacter rubeus TaxID=2027860 RepID=A0AAE6JKU9_9SPHI|nr:MULTISPECIES: hypothetical protein [Mucilaginibacter]QEM06422.1 hypothetical protein DIU31_023980 [Mucilaginibacter rubeus]QEM19006.1 hypothetical protein DIU38_024210 [Mucilaginibacter gossypii]QTE44453.1 hypothetical protein J3L19_03495 [Mucilaginibacter rubeus]QTE51052.1 hypothetical protein J3L21_03470 [Mucilaginibacter rubeus]QTE56135.1 hypothetical protein J3L23_28710 [Mucilaginibacter rubeus]
MPSIAKIHEKLLDHLIERRKTDPGLLFMPRQKNNNQRLDKGYWFLGNDKYVFVCLWRGSDWKEKVNFIGFVVMPDRSSYIELSAQGNEQVVPFLEKVAKLEKGFDHPGTKHKWFKAFPGKNNDEYLKNFDYFIKIFKPKVDHLLEIENPPGISKVSDAQFQKFGIKVIELRNRQVLFGKKNKITRLSWNENNWQYPSGWMGKSANPKTHEGQYGFGYEEWLFDRTKLIKGYHYGFIQGMQSKNQIHAGKIYNVHLYAQNSSRNYYYVGCIRDAQGISNAESKEVYQIYQAKGWLSEMAKSLEHVEADVAHFNKTKPEFLFNVRFKLHNIEQKAEMEELADIDDNITTDHFKLLPYRGEYVPSLNPIEPEETDEGKFKNEGKRKRTFNGEQEYDPIHDRMQNAIVEHLRSDPKYGYKHVYIEKSRVDIKAVLPDGTWHYFEIKTDSPKRSIRNAIGQVMEYAYYPAVERAKKIIVVGQREPEPNSIDYLEYLRERFDLPISYRSFDWERLELSRDY